MTFFTGKGDTGTSTVFGASRGERISKSSPIFEALGQLDELNSVIGWCKVACEDFMVLDVPGRDVLHTVQNHLFTIQAEIAGASKTVHLQAVTELESLVDTIEHILPEVTSFLVAGGTELSARLDIARTVARRAERQLVVLQEFDAARVSPVALSYLNRLSSLLYALIRLENHTAGIEEKAPSYT